MLCPSPCSGCLGCERAARKVNPCQPSQGSHPRADTDKLKITGCVKAPQLNLSRCGFHCALASLSLSQDSVFLAAFLPHFARFLFLGGLGWSLQSPTRAKQGGSSSQPLCTEKIPVVLPRLQEQAGNGEILGQLLVLGFCCFLVKENLDWLLSPGCVYRDTSM